ncbi:MAG: substrate-binding domain-containing protein [Chloroflexia bacterium]|nr:substrate-binding domain-containing protein [Chloroflexia bacterium]
MLDSDSLLPLYVQLLRTLQRRLDAGEWRPGDLLPSEAELGRTYNVSRITVARAMSDLARTGAVRRQRGTRPVVAAPAQPAAGAPALAFLTPGLEYDWLHRIYRGFEDAAAANGGYALLTGPRGDDGTDLHHVRPLVTAGPVRGLAFCHATIAPAERAFWDMLRTKQGIPFAFIGIYQPDFVADRVLADNVAAGAMATRHLLGLGHRRIAFLNPTRSHLQEGSACPGRIRGYRQALAEAGLDAGNHSSHGGWVLDEVLPATLSDAEQRERLLEFFERGDITAAVTCNDTLAVLVQHYLDTAGVRVPDDLAMVGISDERIATLARAPVTTVRIEAGALGRTAAELLLARLAGDTSEPREVVIPVSLVIRASCGAAARGGAGEGVVYTVEDAMREAQTQLEQVTL